MVPPRRLAGRLYGRQQQRDHDRRDEYRRDAPAHNPADRQAFPLELSIAAVNLPQRQRAEDDRWQPREYPTKKRSDPQNQARDRHRADARRTRDGRHRFVHDKILLRAFENEQPEQANNLPHRRERVK